jgi:hypothetical protein
MRYIPVPHSGQVPRVAGVAFLLKMASGLDISRFSLHFMQ